MTYGLFLLLANVLGRGDHHVQVFRSMGSGRAEDVKALSPPLAQWRHFRYCESLLGETFGTVDHFEVFTLSVASFCP